MYFHVDYPDLNRLENQASSMITGIDPVTVKYFAYKHGVKYSLRGEEHIIVENGSYGGENSPVPDWNLKNNKPLLNYMLKKWKSISTTKIN
jgi:hypothetical protein